MAILGAIVLLFRALLLAHGGLTTIGANIFSMAIVGPWVTCGTYRLYHGMGLMAFGVYLGATLGIGRPT